MNASRASAWSVTARLVAQASSLLTLLVAARMLSASELGVFALASAVAVLISRLAEAGWTQYVMAWQSSPRPPPTVFWIAVLVASLGGFLGLLGGLGYGALSGDGPFGWLLAGLATLIPFGAITALQYGVLTRNGRIGTLSTITMAGDAIALAVTVAGLLGDAGVLALLLGRAAAIAATFAASALAARWLPGFAIQRPVARAAIAFVRRLAVTQLIDFGRVYGAEFLLAAFLGTAEVGIYRLASRIVGAITEVFSEPLRTLSWATLTRSRAAAAPGWTPRADGERIVFSAALLALPAFVGLALVSGALVETLLGPGWSAVAPVVAVLALARLFALPVVLAEPMLVLVGQAHLLPLLSAVSTAVGVPFLAALAAHGPVAAAAAQLATSLAMLPVYLWAQARHAGIRWGEVAHELKPAAAAVALLAAAVTAASWKMAQWHGPSWMSLAGGVLAGGLVYAALLLRSYGPFCRTVIASLRQP